MSSPLGRLIRSLREQKGWTQEALAQETGISVRTIQRLEGEGTKRPQAANLRSLAEAFGVELVVLQEASRQNMVYAEPQAPDSVPTAASTPVIPSEPIQPAVPHRNTGNRIRTVLLSTGIAVLLMAGAFALFISPQLSRDSKPVYLAGRILCMDNEPVVGVWVKAINGPEGMASLRNPNSNGSEATFVYIFTGDAYDLHVGCGGSGQHWNNLDYTETGSGTVHDRAFHYFRCYDTLPTVGFGSCDLKS